MSDPRDEPLDPATLAALEPLRRLLHEGPRNGVFPVVGSGLSRGLPSWDALLGRLIDKAPATERDELRAALDNQRYLDVADALESLPGIGRETIAALIRHEYQWPKLARPEIYDLLAALPVEHFATVNYDPWLKDAVSQAKGRAPRVYVPGDPGAFSDLLPGAPPLVLMLHGDASRPASCVLSGRAYRQLMYGNPAFEQGLRALLMQRQWLFIGTSLSDPDLLGLLEAWAEVFGYAGSVGAPRHFYLGAGLSTLAQRRLLARGVQPIAYGPAGDHTRLPSVLRALASPLDDGTTHARARASATTTTTRAPLRPRVLVAGRHFGLPLGLRRQVDDIWERREALGLERALAQARQLVRQEPAVGERHMAALMRYDLILDLSPWRAFERWHSLGCRAAHEIEDWTRRDGPVFAGLADDEGAVAALPRALRQALHTLASAEGVAIAGLASDGDDLEPLRADLADLPRVVEPPATPSSAPWWADAAERRRGLDGPLADASLADYQRALRIVAGQVRLSGDEREVPIADVFVEMELLTTEAERAPRREHDLPEGDGASRAGDDEAARVAAEDWRRERQGREREAARSRYAPARQPLRPEVLPGIAPLVFLEGRAGSGKSTLLRWLAAQPGTGSADAHALRVWVPLPGLRRFEGPSFVATLASAALEAVSLPRGAAAAHELGERLGNGQAVLLLDGYDELDPSLRLSLKQQLEALPTGLRAVLSSRPIFAPAEQVSTQRFRTVELQGLVARGAERFLRAYFPGASWRAELLRALRRLDAAGQWSRTPVLLALAATLYARDQRLPEATLELYDAVVNALLARAERLWGWGDAARREARVRLERVARALLLPDGGNVRLEFERGQLQDTPADLLALRSGLLQGGARLRFTHLSLGEYLAACAVRAELKVECERLERRAERAQHDALAMAHALAGDQALTALLARADAGDTPEHLWLRLLLRALSYGGAHVLAWAPSQASELLARVVARVTPVSACFGDAEQALAAQALRMVLALRRHLPPEAAAGLHAMRALPGLVGGYARLMSAALRGQAERPGEEGRALTADVVELWIDLGVGPREVLALCAGEPISSLRAAAARALSSDEGSRVELRGLLRDSASDVRAAAVEALSSDEGSRVELRGLLRDSDSSVRAAAARALSSDEGARPALRELLRDADEHVRAAAAQALRAWTERLSTTDSIRWRPAAAHLWVQAAGHASAEATREAQALQARLTAFVHAPRPLLLDDEPLLGPALLGYLLRRLGWAAQDGKLEAGRLFGELPLRAFEQPDPRHALVLRLAMDSADLPGNRFVHPMHNLIEAWRVARHLRTSRPWRLFLVCADLPLQDLDPERPTPADDDAQRHPLDVRPGDVIFGPTYFGFGLPHAQPTPAGAGERLATLLISSDARGLWASWSDAERAGIVERLFVLAQRPDVQGWTLAPLVAQLGTQLPAALRDLLAQHLPADATEGVRLWEHARAAARQPEPARAETSTRAWVAAYTRTRALLDQRPHPPAIQAVEVLAQWESVQAALRDPSQTTAEELDQVLDELDRLRDRFRDDLVAQRLLRLLEGLERAGDPATTAQRCRNIRYALQRFLGLGG
jgi:hypothetical protein